jgi:molybdopterin converting factor small subunit
MTVRVITFGPLTDLFAHEQMDITLPASVADIRQEILQNRPELVAFRFRPAIDDVLAADDAVIESAREIALLPPFAGG